MNHPAQPVSAITHRPAPRRMEPSPTAADHPEPRTVSEPGTAHPPRRAVLHLRRPRQATASPS